MNRLLAACISALWMIVLSACGAPDAQAPRAEVASRLQEPPPPPPPPDEGDISHFHACKAPPRRILSERERCQIEKLAARCTPADDCLVSCLASPDGSKGGGGCVHVCFYGPHRGEPRPPNFEDCDSLKGASGMNQRP